MRLIIERNTLKAALAVCKRHAGGRPMPILASVLFGASETEGASVTATDLETAVRYELGGFVKGGSRTGAFLSCSP